MSEIEVTKEERVIIEWEYARAIIAKGGVKIEIKELAEKTSGNTTVLSPFNLEDFINSDRKGLIKFLQKIDEVLESQKPRKVRKDKGVSKKKEKAMPENLLRNKLVIKVPKEEGQEYQIACNGLVARGATIKETLKQLLEKLGGKWPKDLTIQDRGTIEDIESI